MFYQIKKKIDSQLKTFLRRDIKYHYLRKVSPLLYGSIKDFVLRDGKRIRPVLFLCGYLGYCRKIAKNIYTSALAIELLHDFMLIHDDIIDKSETRRGRPSMHALLNEKIKNSNNIKFDGKDLAIVTGDVLYAIAIDAFLSVEENPLRKEKALKRFTKAAIDTGTGEFIELMAGTKDINDISEKDILKIYDYKTAQYTFSAPLASGAILAGAKQNEIDKLNEFGIYLGRAFQIKDDILGMFGDEKKTGKPAISDLQEAKKTLLIRYAYKNSGPKEKKAIKAVFNKKKVTLKDLLGIRKIMEKTGSLEYAKQLINKLISDTEKIISSLKIKSSYKKFLKEYPQKILLK